MSSLPIRHLPNALTVLRMLLSPVVAVLLFMGVIDTLMSGLQGDQRGTPSQLLYAAAVVFAIAALTDLLDGWAARALNAESRLGRVLDPIADKLLVGMPLLVYGALAILTVGLNPLSLLVVACVAVIVVRDLAMTVIRLRAPDGEGPRVSRLAKYKTALEMGVVGYWPVLFSIDGVLGTMMRRSPGEWLDPLIAMMVWLALLVLAAALSALTAWSYLRRS